MRPIPALRPLLLAGLGCLATASSSAQSDSYYYGGLSIGQSRAKIDEERITATLLASGFTTTSMTRDESDPGYKLFGGYQFNRNVALEGGYFNLGKFGFTSTTVPAGTLNGRIRLQGLNLDVVGTLPLGERFSVLGRIGAQYANARDAFSGGGAVHVLDPDPGKRAIGLKLGAGFQYALSPSLLIRAEAERYRINDAVGNHGDINLFSVSLVFPFGRAPAPAPRAAASPAYVAPVPEPVPPKSVAAAPVAAVVPPIVPPARQRVTFAADSLFAFDESVIRPEGRTALDKFAKALEGTQFDVIKVQGHTDRLGSTAYNRKLSAQRAEAVKAYLVGSGNIDDARISAIGKDESAPVTPPGTCQGDKPSARLIACLQPDRRVEVEVAGLR